MSEAGPTKTSRGSSPRSPEGTQGATAGILPAQHWVAQDAGLGSNDDNDDNDSAVGADNASSTASITSSILRYRTIQGRTYHSQTGNAQYWGSNDDKQNEVLDIIHHVATLVGDGKIFFAPVKKDIKKALDIGTGTGIWAIDFADEFSDTEVIGTDISPIQPSWVPPNLTFEVEDCTSPWTFAPDSVDFVHLRWLLGSVADWTALFKEAFRVCKPGGFVESFEPGARIECDDGTVSETDAMGQWGKLFIEGGKKIGRPFTVLEDDLQKIGMREAGFVDVEEINFKTPLGSWPRDPREKEIGQYQQLTAEQDLEGTMLFIANTLGWSKEEITVYSAHLRREIRSAGKHGYNKQKVVWGRKPEIAS